jgi:hypothetical protein
MMQGTTASAIPPALSTNPHNNQLLSPHQNVKKAKPYILFNLRIIVSVLQ